MPSEPHDAASLRAKIIGLGERSLRKSYYPQLLRQLEETEKLNRELEKRVAERTAQLVAANEALESFASSVSHDLRAPLRHMIGFASILRRTLGTNLDEQARHYLDAVTDAAEVMGRLINDLLSFSRMGRAAMSQEQVDLGRLVSGVVHDLEREPHADEVVWHVGDLPVVTADQAMLKMAFTNLLSNALKFTRPRSRAEIEVGCVPGSAAAEVVIFVRDNGVGFDMRYADKLFGMFQRLHDASAFEGTGVGLANVRRIIARHGGRTWAEGKMGAGATFYFSLPHKA